MVRLAFFTLVVLVTSVSAAPAIMMRDDPSEATRTDTKFLRDDARVDTVFLKRSDDGSRVDTAFLKRDGVSDRSDAKFLKRDDGLSGAVWHKRGPQLDSLNSARGDDSERTDAAFL